MDVKGKVIIITGSSQGIGKECAIQLANLGANVVITYNKNKKDGESVFKQCNKLSPCLLVKLDVRNENMIKSLIKKVIRKFERLDVLVNNAGVFEYKKLEDQSFEEIKEQIDINLTGLILMSKYALPHLVKQSESLLINISSVSGKTAYELEAPYCASKFGVRGFTQSIAKEYAERVKTFSVNPSSTATKMNDSQGDSPSDVAKVIVQTIQGKYGRNSGDDVDVTKYI